VRSSTLKHPCSSLITTTLRPSLTNRDRSVLVSELPTFSAEAVLSAIQKYRVTVSNVTASMLAMMVHMAAVQNEVCVGLSHLWSVR
jgi:non-ribosomal peptide synthetase component F